MGTREVKRLACSRIRCATARKAVLREAVGAKLAGIVVGAEAAGIGVILTYFDLF